MTEREAALVDARSGVRNAAVWYGEAIALRKPDVEGLGDTLDVAMDVLAAAGRAELEEALRATLGGLVWFSGNARISFPEFPDPPGQTAEDIDAVIDAARALLLDKDSAEAEGDDDA